MSKTIRKLDCWMTWVWLYQNEAFPKFIMSSMHSDLLSSTWNLKKTEKDLQISNFHNKMVVLVCHLEWCKEWNHWGLGFHLVNRWCSVPHLVSSAAVFWDVTQCSPQRMGGALRDIPTNGCGGDYTASASVKNRLHDCIHCFGHFYQDMQFSNGNLF